MTPRARPRLAAKAKLRRDPKTARHVLLSPERGLVLSASAEAILLLCDGEHTVSEIVELLRLRYDAASPGVLERDVSGLLQALRERGLIEGWP